jgi:hypothetical protein
MSGGGPRGYVAVPEVSLNDDAQQRRLIQTVNRINGGKINATLDVTLAASATSTVVTDPRLSPFSFVAWCPLTANASLAERAGIWVSQLGKGSMILSHASAAAADQNFRMLIIG